MRGMSGQTNLTALIDHVVERVGVEIEWLLPPRHLNASPEEEAARRAAKLPKQSSFLE